jgi:hypothetical protein
MATEGRTPLDVSPNPRLDPATHEAFRHLRLLGVMSRRGTIRAQAE